MVGQEKLIKKFESYSIKTLPHTIMLIGGKGCGKHTFVRELSHKFNVDLVDITNDLTFENITSIYSQPLPKFYIIDTSCINEKQQNIILKFIEEPLNNSFIFLLCDNKNALIGTIINRCVSFEFEQYTKEQLEQFVKDIDNKDYILSVCKTPGKVMEVNGKTIEKTNELCDLIIDRLNVESVSLSNALNISNKVNFKDEYDKIDIDIFYDIMSSKLVNKYMDNNLFYLSSMYSILQSYKNKMLDSRISKKNLFESMIIDMWSLKRE